MIEYKNTIDSFYGLEDLCWGGAIDRLNEIADNDLEDLFMEYLQEQLCNGFDTPTLTEINDFIWFDCDEWIEENTKGDENDED